MVEFIDTETKIAVIRGWRRRNESPLINTEDEKVLEMMVVMVT
jgi:hypothetical protein